MLKLEFLFKVKISENCHWTLIIFIFPIKFLQILSKVKIITNILLPINLYKKTKHFYCTCIAIINKLLIIDKHCINYIELNKISFSKHLAFILKFINAPVLKKLEYDKETGNFSCIIWYLETDYKTNPLQQTEEDLSLKLCIPNSVIL